MSENLTSKNIQNDQSNLNNQEFDYKNLITKLKEINITINLLEKTLFK